MRQLLLAFILCLTVTACGGGDGIDDAANCTELGVAVSDIEELTDEQFERLREKMTELIGQAAANDAQLEVAICVEVADQAVGQEVEQTFQDITEQLEGD